MTASGLLHPIAPDGRVLEATFELTMVPIFDLVYHHKAGARDSPRSVNADYHEGLELLLQRLAAFRATILGISVDSGVARDLPEEDRELDLEFPIDLTPDTDIHEVRLAITRAQKSVARRPGSLTAGGNDQKRIRITLTGADPSVFQYERIRADLIGRGGVDSRVSRPERSPKRRFPKVKDLMAAGVLVPGVVVHASARGQAWTATLLEDGQAVLEGRSEPQKFGRLTNEVAGHSESAMRLWSVEREGVMVPLQQLRDELVTNGGWSAPDQGRSGDA
jgi:hypothetical protein